MNENEGILCGTNGCKGPSDMRRCEGVSTR